MNIAFDQFSTFSEYEHFKTTKLVCFQIQVVAHIVSGALSRLCTLDVEISISGQCHVRNSCQHLSSQITDGMCCWSSHIITTSSPQAGPQTTGHVSWF